MKRYEFTYSHPHTFDAYMAETEDGEYVEYEDAVELIKEALAALVEAEGFIASALPHYAADRNEAVNAVLPALRASIAKLGKWG